jgi:hypothetical protein
MKDFRRQHQTVDPTGDEVIGFSVWDRQTFTSATTTKLTFFTQVRTLLRDGNLTFAGGFPLREDFLVRSIRVVPIIRPDQRVALAAGAEGVPVSRADDLAQVYNDGVMQFFILSKNYGQYPLFLLLPGYGIVANNATLTTTAQASNYIVTATVGNPDNRSVFSLDVPIPIPAQTGFNATLEWAAALTLESGNLDLETVLDGRKIRPKQ